MARLPRYLVPVVVAVPSLVMAAVVTLPSLARPVDPTNPGGPADPARTVATSPATPQTTGAAPADTPAPSESPTPDQGDRTVYPSTKHSPDPLRDWITPSGPSGACTACVGGPVTGGP